MGIPGLKSFVNSKVSLKKVASADFNGLVVDGKSLIYHLIGTIRLTCTFGGQYPELERILEDLFKALLSNRIHVVVVFDGIDYNDQKHDTKLRRKKKSYCDIRTALRENRELDLLPPLADLVFCHVLRKLGIRFIFVDGDADQKIAQIANFYHYPVIADDSDYYIFDLHAGYMPLSTFEWTGGSVSALLYKRSILVESAGFDSPDLILGIPLLLGNDFYDAVIRRSLGCALQGGPGKGRAAKNVALTIDVLLQFSSLDECIKELPGRLEKPDPAGVQSMCDGVSLMKRMYDAVPPFITDPIAEMETCALMLQNDGRPVPKELLYFFRKGLANMTTLEALCKEFVDLPTAFEDLDQPSCYNIGESLRATLYALVHLDRDTRDVKELVRCHPYNDNFKFASVKVVRSSLLPMVPHSCKTFKEVGQLPLGTRKEVIMHCLQIPLSTATTVQGLPPSFHLLAMVTRYWYHNAVPKPRPLELRALIVCLLVTDRGTKHKVQKFNLRTTHSCVQWQKVYMDIHDLNNLLSEPFSLLPPISELFDGQLLHFLTRDLPLQDEDIPRKYRLNGDQFHRLVSVACEKGHKATSVPKKQQMSDHQHSKEVREASTPRQQPIKTVSSTPFRQTEDAHGQSTQYSQATNAQGRQRSTATQATNAQGQQHSRAAQVTNAQGQQRSTATQATNAQGQQHSRATQATNAQGQQHSRATQATNAQGQQHSRATQATNAQGQQHSRATQATNAQGQQHSRATQATDAQGQQHSRAAQATNAQGQSTQHGQPKKKNYATSSPHTHTTRHTNGSSVARQTRPKQFQTPSVPLANRFALLAMDNDSSSSESD